MRSKFLSTTATAVVALAGFSAAAQAQSALDQLEMLMEQSGAPANALTYDLLISDDADGFVIEGVHFEPDPGDGVMEIDRLAVEAIDLEGLVTGAPQFLSIEIDHAVMPPEQLDGDMIEVFGEEIWFDLAIDYVLDPASGDFSLNHFSLGINDLGTISASADLENLSVESIAAAMFMGPEALTDTSISYLNIALDDNGFLETVFNAAAAEEGVSIEEFVQTEVLGDIQGMQMMFGSDPTAAAALEAFVGFLSDYAAPQGPMTITANPDAPVSLAQLAGSPDPTAIPAMLGLAVGYAGGGGSGEDGGLFDRSDADDADVEEQASVEADADMPAEEVMEEAEASPPATGDGAFASLLALMPTSPDGHQPLTYDAILADDAESFILSGVVFQPDPGDEPLAMEMLSVSSIDMPSIQAGGPPTYLQLAAQGIAMPTEELDADFYAMVGMEEVITNIFIDYALDQASNTFTLNGVTMEMEDLFQLTLTFELGNVGLNEIMGMAMMGPEALANATIQSGALSYQDLGMMQRAIAFAAAEEGLSEEQLMEGLFAQMELMQGMFAGDPLASSAFDALGEFLEDYQDPQGAIGIVVNPPEPLTLADINNAADPSQIPAMLGLTIGY